MTTGSVDAAGTASKEKKKEECEITVLYDGRPKELGVNLKAATNALLEHAMNAFGITANRHTMGLWTEAGAELDINASLESQGIRCGAALLLRPSAVRGGRW